jgi:hypothetical protein
VVLLRKEIVLSRLLELKQELTKLAQLEEDVEGDSMASWEVLSIRQTMLHLEMSHEELVQMTSIANALNAMRLDSVAELVGLKRQVDHLFDKVADLQALQNGHLMSQQDHLDKVFEQQEEIETVVKPDVTQEPSMRKVFDFSTTPHKG